MLDWQTQLAERLEPIRPGDSEVELYLQRLTGGGELAGAIHLAILVEPYLQYILEGRKTVESRFSVHRCAPYQKVARGDIVLLKRSSGPIVGICLVGEVWFYQLDPTSWLSIKTNFASAICAPDPAFWQAREHAAYATLMRIQHVKQVAPLSFDKRDRRGWVVLKEPGEQLGFAI